MIKVYQYGSSLDSEHPNDIDLFVITDKPVDLCIYTPDEWEKFRRTGKSTKGRRIVIYPCRHKPFPPKIRRLKDE